MPDKKIVTEKNALVSVIIPCYNHSHYLPVAIESVLKQTYSPLEIIVVDDGSTDSTKKVAQSYDKVIYVYQNNQGLSASRNTGIRKSKGAYLLFLDADDWLYPDAIKINVGYLQQQKNAAYVSGAYDMFNESKNITTAHKREIPAHHYMYLLRENYIAMIATVLFQRWVFDEFLYDVKLKSCEDYDLYLKISRKYSIIHHTEKIAAYRIHSSNMSSNIPVILSSALYVLQRQKQELKNRDERQAYKKGQKFWTSYYTLELYKQLRLKKAKISKTNLYFLLKNKKYLFFKFLIVHPLRKLFPKKIPQKKIN